MSDRLRFIVIAGRAWPTLHVDVLLRRSTEKKVQEMQRKQAVKEVRFSATIADNDMQVLHKNVRYLIPVQTANLALPALIIRPGAKRSAWPSGTPSGRNSDTCTQPRCMPKALRHEPGSKLAARQAQKKKRKGPRTHPGKATQKRRKAAGLQNTIPF